ncbi:MAG: tail protein X [Lysobacteraceae bacterium]
MQLRAHQGDSLDLLLWRATGRTAAIVEAVLAANPGLAARGEILPEGLLVDVPDAAVALRPQHTETIQLWS